MADASRPLPQLPADPGAPFPPLTDAWREPNGLLAWGGDLGPIRLMKAYRAGIFPWFSEGDPILWWSPDPRAVFDTAGIHLSRRFRRQLRQSAWTIRVDHDFSAVVRACANAPRAGQDGTWIVPQMLEAYAQLHQLGHAHCLSVHADGRMIGGIYGVDAGPVFCGESMFSLASGASRLALAALCRLLREHQVRWVDAQMHTPHLSSLGLQMHARDAYLQMLASPPSSSLPRASWAGLALSWEARDFS